MPIFIEWFGMRPLWNNICSVLISVIYMKIILETSSFIRRSLGRVEEARRLIHIMTASSLIFWPLYDTSHWSWRLNVLVPTVYGLRIFYKGALLKNPDDEDVQIMSRSSSPSELLYGPLQLTLLLIWLGLYRFMRREACIAVAAVGLGDGIAPLIGRTYGRHFYRMPFGRVKTMEGTMFCFLGAICGMYLYPHVLGLQIYPLRMVLAYSAIAALAEGCSPANFDNVVVPVVLHFSLQRVQRWLTQ